MGRDPRIDKAFRAMKSIGIPGQKVKPVLKRLLKLYDNNWELIEDDNYRTLADAIFEFENDQNLENNGASTNDMIEPPSKKSNRALSEVQALCTVDNVGLEEGEIPQSPEGQKLTETFQPIIIDSEGEPSPVSGQASNGERINSLTPSQVTGENLITERARTGVCTGQEFNEPGSLQMNEEIHEFPDHGNGRKRTREESSNCLTLPRSSFLSEGKRVESNGPGSDFGTSWQYRCDIASSKCGQARILLSCKHGFGKQDFQSQNLDAVLKYAEQKYLSSYKIIGPKFSLFEVFRYFCDCYIELTTDSAKNSMVNKSSLHCHPRVKDSKKSRSMTDIMEKDVKLTGGSSSSGSPNRAVLHHQQSSPSGRKVFHKIHDITNGTEKVNIALLDEIGKECAPNFVYIPQNIVYQNAYIHVSLARIVDEDCCSQCSGDCLSSSVPCACARDTGGEFAYTPEGILREEFLKACISMNQEPEKHYHVYCADCPLERAKNVRKPGKCKGHLVRKFIKECWRKCGCNMLCGNRVVQRGINRNLQVFLTEEGKGWGLRTLEALPEGAFVCEYVGEILTNMELYERNQHNTGKERHTYPVLLDADWGSEGVLKDEDALCLDATYYGNVARFINHRCFDANLLEIPVEVETPDHHYYHLAFFTKQKVDAFEELTWDYKLDFDDHNHPIKAFQCCCRSDYCRDKKATKAKMHAQ